MNCDTVVASLPWYLNRSLPPEEREAMGKHLGRCPACREELTATLEVARLHTIHPATESLVALAFGELGEAERDPVERHVDHCASCQAELGLAEASADLEAAAEDSKVVPFPGTGSTRRTIVGRWAAAAAVVAVAILGVWSFFVWQGPGEADRWALERGRLEERLGELEAQRELEKARAREAERELSEARELLRERAPDLDQGPGPTASESDTETTRIAVLERRVRDLAAPRAGHPVLELLPEDLVLRTGDPGAPVPRVPEDSPWVTVLLSAPGVPSDRTYRIELREDGRTLWRSEPTAPDELGGFSLLLPSTRLRAPGLRLVVLREGADPEAEPMVTYRLE